MLLYLADWLTNTFSAFNAFTYITLRAIMAALTALVMSFVLDVVIQYCKIIEYIITKYFLCSI